MATPCKEFFFFDGQSKKKTFPIPYAINILAFCDKISLDWIYFFNIRIASFWSNQSTKRGHIPKDKVKF